MVAKKATVMAVVNQKGGTGKTTTTENLGVGLAMEGKKVLVVDTDPQASLTISLGYPVPDELPVLSIGRTTRSPSSTSLPIVTWKGMMNITSKWLSEGRSQPASLTVCIPDAPTTRMPILNRKISSMYSISIHVRR